MRAAVLREPKTFDIVHIDKPRVGATEALVKVRVCGICGSDLHAYKGLSPDIKLPIILGHEFSGDVVEIGRNVDAVQVGERVCVEPVIPCGNCYFCRKGEYNRCVKLGLIGCQSQGAFAEYVSVDEKWIHKLPQNLSYEEGALIEPLAVAVHSVERAGIKGGEVAVIFGAGTIGILVLQVLKSKKVSKVVVVEPVSWRRDLAKTIGADIVINPQKENVVAKLLEVTSRIGADVSFEAVGSNEVLRQAIKVTRKGGTIVLIGIYEVPNVSYCIMDLIFNELVMKGSAIYCRDFGTAIKLVEQGKVNLKRLVTHVFPLTEVKTAFEIASKKTEPVLKILLRP